MGEKNFIAGGLTWVDFAVADFVQILTLLDSALINDFPSLVSYQQRVFALPELANYWKSDRYHERP
ncbi:MAG: glutathione S-transferase family protein, partial [Flammeovirgaceae bacterium]